ncbi:MAG: hypothetical protein HQL56_08135 [Magnetococcales bacterium]|nr:hypothetical protein [Magnetococcales bacterium]
MDQTQEEPSEVKFERSAHRLPCRHCGEEVPIGYDWKCEACGNIAPFGWSVAVLGKVAVRVTVMALVLWGGFRLFFGSGPSDVAQEATSPATTTCPMPDPVPRDASLAPADYDINTMTSYAVILGRASACGVYTDDAKARVLVWMAGRFPKANPASKAHELIFHEGVHMHTRLQASGKSPDSCQNVIKVYNNMTRECRWGTQ